MKNNGGTVFPISDSDYVTRGLTLRDYFAGQALVGLILRGLNVQEMPANKREYAVVSYKFADAMIAEKEEE